MNAWFRVTLFAVAGWFTAMFAILVVPALLDSHDLVAAVRGGPPLNPYAAGYVIDALACWVVLAAWVISERRTVRHGWVALVFGLVPGVVVGLAVYLLLRRDRPFSNGGKK